MPETTDMSYVRSFGGYRRFWDSNVAKRTDPDSGDKEIKDADPGQSNFLSTHPPCGH